MITRRALLFALVTLHATLVPRAPAHAQRMAYLFDSDSIRLERRPGGFDNTDYQIVVDQAGRIRVRPDSMRRYVTLPRRPDPQQFRTLMAHASITLFVQLPDTMAQHPVFGRVCGTDAGTAVVSIFGPRSVKTVVDYQGCVWVPAGLRDLEAAIDRAAGRRVNPRR